MRATIWFHPEFELKYSMFEGDLTADGIMAWRSAIACDSRHNPDDLHLLDMQEVSAPLLSSEEIRDLALEPSHSPDAKRAIVARREILYATARMADAWYAETRPNSRTFTSIEEACEWLDIPDNINFRCGNPLVVEG